MICNCQIFRKYKVSNENIFSGNFIACEECGFGMPESEWLGFRVMNHEKGGKPNIKDFSNVVDITGQSD
jgi:hypothetical protein